MQGIYHGECVALGMLPMCDKKLRPRVIEVLKKCNLYREIPYDWDKITEAAFHDKKADGDTVSVVTVDEIGSFKIRSVKCIELIETAKACLKG
jgi:3-dehydroquinate synthase